jgi:hypothetical protein
MFEKNHVCPRRVTQRSFVMAIGGPSSIRSRSITLDAGTTSCRPPRADTVNSQPNLVDSRWRRRSSDSRVRARRTERKSVIPGSQPFASAGLSRGRLSQVSEQVTRLGRSDILCIRSSACFSHSPKSCGKVFSFEVAPLEKRCGYDRCMSATATANTSRAVPLGSTNL